MNRSYYILDGHTPRHEPDVVAWSRWMATSNCRVAESAVGGFRVTTVFLGRDHNFEDEGDPILFETMILGGNGWQDYQSRASTWREAEAQHETACRLATAWHADQEAADQERAAERAIAWAAERHAALKVVKTKGKRRIDT